MEELIAFVISVLANITTEAAKSVRSRLKHSKSRKDQNEAILAAKGMIELAVAEGEINIDSATLEAIKRDNISNDVYHELQKRFTKDGIETYSDLIIALPNETNPLGANAT